MVKRYGQIAVLGESVEGKYVLYEDYKKLEERLTPKVSGSIGMLKELKPDDPNYCPEGILHNHQFVGEIIFRSEGKEDNRHCRACGLLAKELSK